MATAEKTLATHSIPALQKEIQRLQVKARDWGQHPSDRAEWLGKLRAAQELLANVQNYHRLVDRQVSRDSIDRLGTEAQQMAMHDADPDWAPHGLALHQSGRVPVTEGRDRDKGKYAAAAPTMVSVSLGPDGKPPLSRGMELRIFGREVVRMVYPLKYLDTRQAGLVLDLEPKAVRRACESGLLEWEQPTGDDGRIRVTVESVRGYILARIAPSRRAEVLGSLIRLAGLEDMEDAERSA